MRRELCLFAILLPSALALLMPSATALAQDRSARNEANPSRSSQTEVTSGTPAASAPTRESLDRSSADVVDKTEDRVTTRKVIIPARATVGPDALQPLTELSAVLRDSDLTPPPDSDVADLVSYLNEMSKLNHTLESDYRTIRFKISQSQAQVANRLLAVPNALSDQDFYIAAKFALAKQISEIPTAESAQQRRIYELVMRQIRIGLQRELGVLEVRNAVRTVGYLERHASRSLAIEASESFATLVAESQNRRFDESVSALKDVQRRLNLIGEPLQLAGTTIDGKPFNWSDYRGKVVLVNYWASWSAPCVAEIPELKRIYNEYRDKGFEIVGVALDPNQVRLLSVIERESIPWANLWSATSPQQHPAAVKYGVDAIPTAFLLDSDGKVISTRARGDNLRREIYRLLGPESFVARDYAGEQRWAEAADALESLIKKQPTNIDYRIGLGAIELLGDDPAGYADTCASAWHDLQDNDGSMPPRAIPLFCLSTQHSLNPSLVLAEAVRQRAESEGTAESLAVVMAAYRAGNDELCRSIKLERADDFSQALAHLFQAMSAARMGDNSQADDLLNQGRRTVSLRLSGPFLGDSEKGPYEHWICWATAGLVLDQAESAVKRAE